MIKPTVCEDPGHACELDVLSPLKLSVVVRFVLASDPVENVL